MKISLGGITDNKHNKYFRIEGRLAIMNISKFTQKSVEAVQNCEKLAYEYGNQQIDQEHLLVSLLKLDDSLILKLITKMMKQAVFVGCSKRNAPQSIYEKEKMII